MKTLKIITSIAMSICCFANLLISAKADTTTVFDDDFSSYSQEVTLDDIYDFNGDSADFCSIENGGENQGDSLYVDLEADRDNTRLYKIFDNAYSEDLLTIEYSIKPGAGMDSFLWVGNTDSVANPSGNRIPVIWFQANGTATPLWESAPIISTWSSETWYDVTAVIDFEDDLMDLTVTDGTNTYTRNDLEFTLADVKMLDMQVWSMTDSGTYFDNIKVTVSQKAQFPYSQDFSSGNASGMYPSLNAPTGVGVVDLGDEHANVYKLQHVGDYSAPCLNRDIPTNTEKLGIKASVKPDVKNRTMLSLRNEDDTWISLVSFAQDGKIEVEWDIQKTGISYTSGEWYDIEAVADFTTDTIDILISNANGALGSYQITGYTSVVKCVYFQIWGTDEAASYIDNVELTNDPDPLPDLSVLQLPITDDFEGYTDFAAASANWMVANADASLGSIVTSDYGKALSAGLNAQTDNTWIKRTFANPIESGKIKISYDVKPDAEIYTLSMALKENGLPFHLVSFTDFGKVYTCIAGQDLAEYDNIKLGNFTPGNWYHCEAVIDLDNKLMSVSYQGTDASGSLEDIAYENFAGEVGDITGAGIQVWSKKDATSYYDNLVVEYAVDEPKLTNNSIKILDSDTVQTDLTKVSAASDSIKIDFNSVMNPLTIGQYISVKNLTDNVDVSFTPVVDGNNVILNLTNGILPNTQYSLSISGDAANIDGVTLGRSFSMSFETGDGEFGAILIGISQNNNEVKELSQLTEGTNATVSIEYENSTRQQKKMVLIYDYYDGFKQIKSICKPITIEADDIKGTYLDTRIVNSLTDVDTVKIMLWDGFNNIVAVSKSITLK